MSMLLTAATTVAIFGFDDECVTDPHTGHEECGEQLPIAVHLLLGGMLAATDPVRCVPSSNLIRGCRV